VIDHRGRAGRRASGRTPRDVAPSPAPHSPGGQSPSCASQSRLYHSYANKHYIIRAGQSATSVLRDRCSSNSTHRRLRPSPRNVSQSTTLLLSVVVIGFGPWSLVVLKDKIAGLGLDLGLDSGLGLESIVLAL